MNLETSLDIILLIVVPAEVLQTFFLEIANSLLIAPKQTRYLEHLPLPQHNPDIFVHCHIIGP